MLLRERAKQEHSRSGYIETRSESGTSLFLSWWTDWSGTTYEIRHGLYGGKVITTVICEPLKRQYELEETSWFYGLQKERKA